MSEEMDFAAMAAPAPELELLKPFVGTFTAVVKMWMGPGEPQITTGVIVNEWDLGGRFLRQTYTGDETEGPFPDFAGRGYWGYNKTDGRWEGFWIDTASTVMQMEYGSVDESGKIWNMLGAMTDPMKGGVLAKRSVIKVIDDDHHSMEMFFLPAGEDAAADADAPAESKGMEIEYTRKT